MNAKDRLNGKLIIALGRTYRNAHRRSNELFREKGLTLPQFTVLELLYNRGEQTIQQIIDKVLSSSGNITVVVRNLEQMELVYRRDNPHYLCKTYVQPCRGFFKTDDRGERTGRLYTEETAIKKA